MDIGKPYKDIEVTDSYVIREFSHNIDPIELLWHRDDEERIIEVLTCGDNWMMQQDNCLPTILHEKMTLHIPKHNWHRAIKGQGVLRVKIHKL